MAGDYGAVVPKQRTLLGEHFPEEVVARAALGADAAGLQLGNALRAVLDGPKDVVFGFCAADADDHGIETMSQPFLAV